MILAFIPIILFLIEFGNYAAIVNLDVFALERFAMDGKVILISHTLLFVGMIFILILYRNRKAKKDMMPLNPIFSFKITNYSSIAYSFLFLFAINIVLGPLSLVFPESLDQMNKVMENLDVYSVISIVIGAPLLEEIVFRGILLSDIKRSHSTLIAILVSSICFGIMHFSIVQSISAFFMGLVFAYIFIETKSLLAPILLHMFQNSVTVSYHLFKDIEFFNTTSYEIFDSKVFYCLIYGLSLYMLYIMFKKLLRYR